MFRWFKLAKRLSELEDQMLKLSRIVSDRDLDWSDMRSRCKRLLDRTEKAARRVVESQESQLQDGEAPEGPENGEPPRGLSFLTPRQKLIQQQILRRRAGMG